MKHCKRTLAILLIVTIIISCCSMTSYSYTTGDDYPYKYSGGIDPWKFYMRQCTSFVAHCLNTRNGVSGFNSFYGGAHWGSGGNWAYAARACGYRVDNNPEIGSVACYTSGHGHVAWVRSVNGNSVTIEEYNWARPGGYGVRVISRYECQYIHIRDIVFRRLNVDVICDGVEKKHGYDNVTFDVTINGKKVAESVKDFDAKYSEGASYKIDHIKIDGCYKVLKTSFTGRLDKDKNIKIKLKTFHDYNVGFVTTAATCTEDGVKTYTCKGCKKKKRETVYAEGHEMVEHFFDHACDGNSYRVTTCTKCGENTMEFVSEGRTDTGVMHIFSPFETKKPATCAFSGEEEAQCLLCDYSTVQRIPAVKKLKVLTTVFRYNGNYRMPHCKVYDTDGERLEEGRDYVVSYQSNRKLGEAKMIFTLKGDYEGTVEKTFQIVSKNEKKLKNTSKSTKADKSKKKSKSTKTKM